MNGALLIARYTRFEMGRILRNPRFLIFSMALPVIMFAAFTATDPTDTLGPITVGPYIMISMASFGAMMAVVAIGTRIALERAGGWSRQLRLTALTGPQYLVCKVLGGFTLALPALIAVFIEAVVLGRAHLSVGTYVEAGIWVMIGMVPLAALGILLGYLVRADNAGQLIGGMTSLMALAGGIWVPVEQFPRWLADVVKMLPIYWSADAGRAVIAGSWIGWHGLLVLALWTALLSRLAVRFYSRDQLRA
ncbi:ABC transporter permease [Pseudofrankia inefficax]|uniref:ABC-2 type transporter n=1 Tax=Pseudofrankia inefficax (strain DSM 45817 / CECT 9037 / DDB 130130 / EuI1c) TaxID=298654 RepID=E3IUM6_PSEI1|nr:ABC transporter permease [Pseudofrankia inefficax]ADP84842.1 ABC-2 type transporter [Pseudofrankia inefficax]